jgi:hypothetical protein
MNNYLFKLKWLYYFIPSLFFLFVLIGELFFITEYNQGIFSYTLDDPYIHLSLAKQVSLGGYGLNSGEYSSPDSSIIWPFFLSPFSSLTHFAYVPLVINTLCSLGVLWTFAFLLQAVDPNELFNKTKLFLLCLLTPALNLVGLVLMGMEHSLQMLLSVLLVLGLIQESRTHHLPLWLGPIIILAPLIRYEDLALSIPALVFLFFRGYYRQALITFFLLGALLSLFSFFLVSIGQPWLPASVLNKTFSAYKTSLLASVTLQLRQNFISPQAGIFLLYCFALIGIVYLTKLARVQKQLVGILITSLILHLLWGKFNWFDRYELYLHASFWFLICYLYWSTPKRGDVFPQDIAFCLLFVLSSIPYFTALVEIPYASHAIYLQQYQMRQFTLKWVGAPVAANDIGWLSFNNPNPVLDLWGLGNYSVYKMRTTSKGTTWINELTQQHHVELVMIYPTIFLSLPQDWLLLGCLSSRGQKLVFNSPIVKFYATNLMYYTRLRKQLSVFRKELPRGVQFQLNCIPQDAGIGSE